MKYGIIQNNQLQLVSQNAEGAKPVSYDEIPEFDQTKQAVFEKGFIEHEDYIFVEVEVREVVQDDETMHEEMPV